jgi:hypothetical protein
MKQFLILKNDDLYLVWFIEHSLIAVWTIYKADYSRKLKTFYKGFVLVPIFC